MNETRPDQFLELQLEKWKKLLFVYSGAAGMLLVTSLAELPQWEENIARVRERSYTIDPWFGIWFVLLLGCLTPGVFLLAGRSWRLLAPTRRQPVAFGFLACGWAALLAFDLRTLPLEPPVLFHGVVLGLGILLGIVYMVLQRRNGKPEELFP
jgi:hypothetical protein